MSCDHELRRSVMKSNFRHGAQLCRARPECRNPSALDTREICGASPISAVSVLAAKPNAGITEYQLELLKHCGGKTFRDGHAIRACPIAINLITLDVIYGHHWPTRTHPNALAGLKRGADLAWRRRHSRVGKGRDRQRHAECESER